MKITILLGLLFLTGCATSTEVQKPIAIDPPIQLMAPPVALQPIPTLSDGSADPKIALGVAIANNGVAKRNADQLAALEEWLTKTITNVKNSGKVK